MIGYVMYVIIIIIHFVKYVIDVKHKPNNLTFNNNLWCNTIKIIIVIYNRYIISNIITINSNKKWINKDNLFKK